MLLFQQSNDMKEEEKRESFRVGKLKKDVWKSDPVEEKLEEDEVKESVRVGKLKRDVWSNSEASNEQKVETEEVKLRGARRINKGNRISCLIENLHSDKKPSGDSDEEVEEESDTEEAKLGDEMCHEIESSKDQKVHRICYCR